MVGEGVATIRQFNGEHPWLSNFWPVHLEHEGVGYPTAEHLFQALKTLNPDERQWVAAAPTPGSAKQRGKKVTLQADYDRVRIRNMQLVLRLKFAEGTELAAKLLATGEAELIEGNTWHDRFWGVCSCPRCGGKGSNMLGQLLMDRRRMLRLGR